MSDEAVVLDVSILLAVEAERPFLGGPRIAELVLTLLVSGGSGVEFPEPVFLEVHFFLPGTGSMDGLSSSSGEEYSSLAALILALALRWRFL